jgi:hypothetical protein
MKAKLDASRYELQLYEEELRTEEERVAAAVGRIGQRDEHGYLIVGTSPDIYKKTNELKEKILQAKVKVRELEALTANGH